MTVLIHHPNQELNLISLQKTVQEKLNLCGIKTFCCHPLWVPLSTEKSLKMISQEIKNCHYNEISSNGEKVFLEMVIESSNSVPITEKLPLLLIEKDISENFSHEILNKNIQLINDFLKSNNLLPLKIKIFRLAKAIHTGNTFAVEDFIWKKLK